MRQSHLPCIDHHHQDPLEQAASHLKKQRKKQRELISYAE